MENFLESSLSLLLFMSGICGIMLVLTSVDWVSEKILRK